MSDTPDLAAELRDSLLTEREKATARAIAGNVVDRLRGAVISAVLPAEVCGWVAEVAKRGYRQQQNLIMGGGSTCLYAIWQLQTSGQLGLELQDTTGRTVWRGQFHPPEDQAAGPGPLEHRYQSSGLRTEAHP